MSAPAASAPAASAPAASAPAPSETAPARTWRVAPEADAGPEPSWHAGGGFTLDSNPGWSATLSGYGALVALFGTDTRGAYSIGGGSLRGRYRYVTLGGYYEMTDNARSGGQWRALGGMAGAWLPFDNWVDFEIAARAGAREFSDDDVRFGPGGYHTWSPTLGLSLGVSDRAGNGLVGGRMGGALVATYDLSQKEKPWRDEVFAGQGQDPIIRTGRSHVGGFSLGLVLELGLDVSDSGR